MKNVRGMTQNKVQNQVCNQVNEQLWNEFNLQVCRQMFNNITPMKKKFDFKK
jgi:hypothetical protein